jgi:hypothetical protein
VTVAEGQKNAPAPEVTVNESHYHSKQDRIFVRAIQGHYNLKDELARLRATGGSSGRLCA